METLNKRDGTLLILPDVALFVIPLQTLGGYLTSDDNMVGSEI